MALFRFVFIFAVATLGATAGHSYASDEQSAPEDNSDLIPKSAFFFDYHVFEHADGLVIFSEVRVPGVRSTLTSGTQSRVVSVYKIDVSSGAEVCRQRETTDISIASRVTVIFFWRSSFWAYEGPSAGRSFQLRKWQKGAFSTASSTERKEFVQYLRSKAHDPDGTEFGAVEDKLLEISESNGYRRISSAPLGLGINKRVESKRHGLVVEIMNNGRNDTMVLGKKEGQGTVVLLKLQHERATATE